jgi:hypothetical protein
MLEKPQRHRGHRAAQRFSKDESVNSILDLGFVEIDE